MPVLTVIRDDGASHRLAIVPILLWRGRRSFEVGSSERGSARFLGRLVEKDMRAGKTHHGRHEARRYRKIDTECRTYCVESSGSRNTIFQILRLLRRELYFLPSGPKECNGDVCRTPPMVGEWKQGAVQQ